MKHSAHYERGLLVPAAGRQCALDGLLALRFLRELPAPEHLEMARLEDLERIDDPNGRGEHDNADAERDQRVVELPVAERPRWLETQQQRVGGEQQCPEVQ